MEPIDVLNVGQKYSKKDLANLLNQPNLKSVREGVASCTNSNSYLLFVDLEKEGDLPPIALPLIISELRPTEVRA
jgi:hypothetical protein